MSKFKGTMANYYQEARSQVKAIKERQMANKKKNERRMELEEAEKESPLHYLRVDARPCRLFKNEAQYYAIENNEGLVPWNGQQDNLIDRYDCRSLLDMYVEPDARALRSRAKTPKELDLEEMLAFESYRDVVRLSCLGLTEPQGIAHVQEENVVLRAQAKSAAQAAAMANLAAKGGGGAHPGGGGLAGVPAGSGMFAAVGFSYGGGGGGEGGGSDSEGSDDEESDEEDEEEAPSTAEDVDMDRMAELFGVEDFSSMLRWAMRQEAEEAEANRNKPKRKWSRKKAALRSKRMAGQNLPRQFATVVGDAGRSAAGAGGGNDLSWIPERSAADAADRRRTDRDSPRYDEEPSRGRGGSAYADTPRYRERESDAPWTKDRDRYRSRSRSPSDGRRRGGGGGGSSRPQMQFITEFSVARLSSSTHPAAAGASRPGGQGIDSGAGAGVRDALPGAADPSIEGPMLLPEEALRLQGVKPDEYRSSRDRERGREYGGGGGKGKSLAAIAAAEAARAVDKARETPQERIKRLMAAQLNKKIQKDSVTAAQKKLQEEREKEARQTTERLVHSSSGRSERDWDRQNDRRDRYRDRSRSRSRSRSPRRRSYHDTDRHRRSPSPYSRRH